MLQCIKVVSPADGKPFCSIADASVGDVDKAVAAARRAFDNKGEVRNQMGPMQSDRAQTSTSKANVWGINVSCWDDG